MKRTIYLILIILLIGAGAYLVYDLSSDKGNTKYVTFAYNDGVNNEYKCKIQEEKINCIVVEPVNGTDEFVGWYDEENNAVDIEGDFNESVTLYPRFLTAQVATEEKKTERKHIITFNMNGGTGSIGKIEVKYEEQLYKLNNLPTRNEYTFMGFYDNKDYKKGKQYYDENGNSVRNYDKASNITLYAGWKKNTSSSPSEDKPEEEVQQFIITFDSNGGSGGQTSKVKAAYGEILPIINSNTPTRNGYTFMGWYDNKDYLNGIQYYNEYCVSVITFAKKKDITLYAGWKQNSVPVTTYTITFNANDGTGSMTAQTVTSNVQTTLKTNTFTRSGYTFTGWNTSSNGSGTSYANGGKIKITSDITLYAQWKQNSVPVPTYTITFNSNGGSGSMSSQTVTSNVQTTIKTNTFTRSGYTFNGWNTSSNGSGISYSNGGNIKITSNTTLYAQWKQNSVPVTTYTITFNANGGSGSMSSQTVTSNVQTTLKTNTFTRNGYTFTGWNTSSNGSGNSYSNGGNIKITSNITLYAEWKANTYTVSFNLNNGSGNTPGSLKATYNSAMPKLSISTPTRSGYTFKGWYDNSDYLKGKIYYNTDGSSARPYDKTSNTTLYAGWLKNETQTYKYTITFNANGGSGGQSGSIEVTYGGPLPSISKTPPTKSEYTFMGWYDSNNYTNGIKYYDANGNAARQKYDVVKSNVTLYAGWQKKTVPTYTITFNANGGSGTMTSQTVTSNVQTTLKANTFTRSGYKFIEWKDDKGNSYGDKGSISITKNTTLYAQWEKIGNLKIYFLSLGRFDGFLIMGNGTTIFIDGGFTSQGEKCAKFMKELGITRIDAIIGSHLHDNHINAHTVLLDNFEVGAAYYNDDPLTCKSRRTCSDNDTVKKEKLKKLTNMLKEKNIPINILTPGFNIKIGNLTFDVLAPLELGYGINRNSLHLILKYGNKKFYFTGDSDDKVFKAVYDKYNHSIFENIDIFKHPHHGGNEVPKYFIDVMKPKYVVVPNTEKGLAAKEYKDVNSIVYELGKKLMDDKTIITGSGKDLKGYLLAETDGVTLTITDKRK